MPLPAEFAAALDACREPDWVLLGIIADWLDEHGDPDAEGLRWAVEKRRWPEGDEMTVVWYAVIGKSPEIGAKLSDYWSKGGFYQTSTAAFIDLSRMIRLARADGYDAWKWEPNK